MASSAYRRLLRDFKKVTANDAPEGISAAPVGDDLFQWTAIVFGPADTPWEGGVWKLDMAFPPEYPDKPPTVRFRNEVFHPNVFPDGQICLDLLRATGAAAGWSPSYDAGPARLPPREASWLSDRGAPRAGRRMPVASLGVKKPKKLKKGPRKHDLDGDNSDASGTTTAQPPGGAGVSAALSADNLPAPADGDPAHGAHGEDENEDWGWEETGPDEYFRYLAKEEATKLLREHKQTMLDSIRSTVDEAINPFAEQFSKHAESAAELAQGVKEQIDGMHIRLRAHETRLDTHDSDISFLKAEISKLHELLAVANDVPKAPLLSAAGFDRDADPCVIKVIAAKLTALDQVQQTLSDWITEVGVEPKFFKISFPEAVSRSFSINFVGAPAPAARRVAKVLGAQRLGPGQWKRFETTAADGQSTALHIGPDKNPRHIRMEMQGAQVKASVLKLPSGLRNWHLSWRSRRIACHSHAFPRVLGLPETLAEKEVSDHAAQSCFFSQRSTKPEGYRKIPRHIFESKAFQDLLDTVTRQLDFTPRSPPGQIELFKWAVNEVAREIRDRLMRHDSEALGSQLLLASGAKLCKCVMLTSNAVTWRQSSLVDVLPLNSATNFKLSRGVHLFGHHFLVGWSFKASKIQRGFIPQRNFGVNILELDTVSRVYSDVPSAESNVPVLVALDYGAAFPSLSQEFMRAVLNEMQAPRACLSIIDQLYLELEAFAMVRNTPTHAWWVTSGIVQGCSLSGSLYAAATAPFLVDLQRQLEAPRRGIARACADDIGAAIRAILSLSILADIMLLAERFATLSLRIDKCNLVPLHKPFSEAEASEVRPLLCAHVPFFNRINIVESLKRLGLILGPAADADSCWTAPAMKAHERSKLVGHSHLPVSRLPVHHNIRITAVLSYVAPFRMMPQWLVQSELVAFVETLFNIKHGPFQPAIYTRELLSIARQAATHRLLVQPSGVGLQRYITLAVKKHLISRPVWNVLVVRLALAHPDMYCDGASKVPAARWSHIAKCLRSCSTLWAMAYLKSAANGWTTSSRILGDRGRLPCRFGCAGAADQLKHYLSCPKFRNICEEVLGFSRPDHPLGRLGLFGSAVDIGKVVFDIVVMHFAYHAASRAAPSGTCQMDVDPLVTKPLSRTAEEASVEYEYLPDDGTAAHADHPSPTDEDLRTKDASYDNPSLSVKGLPPPFEDDLMSDDECDYLLHRRWLVHLLCTMAAQHLSGNLALDLIFLLVLTDGYSVPSGVHRRIPECYSVLVCLLVCALRAKGEVEDSEFLPLIHEADNRPTDMTESDPNFLELAAEIEGGVFPDHVPDVHHELDDLMGVHTDDGDDIESLLVGNPLDVDTMPLRGIEAGLPAMAEAQFPAGLQATVPSSGASAGQLPVTTAMMGQYPGLDQQAMLSQAMMAQQALLGQQALLDPQALLAQQAMLGQQALLAQQAMLGQQALLGQQAMMGQPALLPQQPALGQQALLAQQPALGQPLLAQPLLGQHPLLAPPALGGQPLLGQQTLPAGGCGQPLLGQQALPAGGCGALEQQTAPGLEAAAAAPSGGKGFGKSPLPGDWNCPACGDYQFARNTHCRRCGSLKPPDAGLTGAVAVQPAVGVLTRGLEARPGDWSCPQCGMHVFARHQVCPKCGTKKPENADMPVVQENQEAAPGGFVGGEGWQATADGNDWLPPGDWLCPSCGDHQFARNIPCRKCGAARPLGGGGCMMVSGQPVALQMRPGDWQCPGCGDHVFAKNPVCRKCQTPNPNGPTVGLPCGGGPAAITPKPGDWSCPACGDLVFARNSACRRCGTLKPPLDASGI
ncbi:unnamed protein product [Prorocentrum cordatum]|uniref:Uncharacterized protein n=1 Tax=Prorocentrum cordatum TaxID=2364126 RepID=A0ABN9QRY8_9DINO|nr:unnamed protein product [Polarella glacialis]